MVEDCVLVPDDVAVVDPVAVCVVVADELTDVVAVEVGVVVTVVREHSEN